MHKYKPQAIFYERCVCHEHIIMPYVNQPLPISNYEHELFNCFIIKPMWDTTNAIITHLDLPFRAASVQDLFEPIVKFMPNNIAHILNSNLIFLDEVGACRKQSPMWHCCSLSQLVVTRHCLQWLQPLWLWHGALVGGIKWEVSQSINEYQWM